jgi:hypothetical protein
MVYQAVQEHTRFWGVHTVNGESKRLSETTNGLYKPLNVYTRQNPRRHVVLKETSQMRSICTQIGTNLSACLFYLHQILSRGWFIFVDMYMNICTYIRHYKVYMNKVYM